MRLYRFVARFLRFGALAFTLSCASAKAQPQPQSLFCVQCCKQRTATGMSLMYGPRFCTPSPETSSVPHCDQRSISGACLHYGPDFCGVAPVCGVFCEERSVTGM